MTLALSLQSQDPKSHLMRVQVGSLNIKRTLLSNAKKLRNIQSVHMKDVCITPDLSVQERKVQRVKS